MRTKRLKINGEDFEAVLVCGGKGFKVYHHNFHWYITKGRSLRKIENNTTEDDIVSKYVNLKYYNLNSHDEIKEEFNKLLNELN